MELTAVGICTSCLARAKTVYYTHGYWIQLVMPMITMRVISINTVELLRWVSCTASWVDGKSQPRWFNRFWSFVRTIWSSWQRIETCCSLINHHRLSEQFIKVRLFWQSPNIIWTDFNRQKVLCKEHYTAYIHPCSLSYLKWIKHLIGQLFGGISLVFVIMNNDKHEMKSIDTLHYTFPARLSHDQ
jgi:hypothetical protein